MQCVLYLKWKESKKWLLTFITDSYIAGFFFLLWPNVSGFLIKHSQLLLVQSREKKEEEMRSLQRWNWVCRDSASFVTCDVQKSSNRFIFTADEMQVGSRSAGSCWRSWRRTRPQLLCWPRYHVRVRWRGRRRETPGRKECRESTRGEASTTNVYASSEH